MKSDRGLEPRRAGGGWWPVAVATVMVLRAISPAAIERRPIPDFAVTALDGTSVKSADLVRQGRWLIVYVQLGCAPCDSAFETLDVKAHPDLPGHIAIIVGGVDAAGVARLATNFSDLTAASWYADPPMALRGALSVSGAPAVFGLRNAGLEWSILGVPSAAGLRSAISSWVGAKTK